MSKITSNDPKLTVFIEKRGVDHFCRIVLQSRVRAPLAAETTLRLSHNPDAGKEVWAAGAAAAEYCDKKYLDNYDPVEIGNMALEMTRELLTETL